MGIERAIQSALAKTRSFEIVEGKLRLFGPDGSILARLEPSPLK
jgi:hypothetical protein